MDNEVVLKINSLSKKFPQTLKRSMFYGTIDIAKSMLGIESETAKLRKTEFWAVDNINLELKKGESLGLLGQNGCGKTTLLRLINGIFPPDIGSIEIKGRIGALIAVGAGFHPHMTGRENIYLNGTILGMTRTEINKKFDSILDFAEIGKFIDSPVATYSSGMTIRLGFSIAIHCDPDILLVDEILAVGDSKFQRKCLDKIRELRKKGVSIILVSHNTQNIEAICKQALLMHNGKQILYGSPDKVVPAYELLLKTGKIIIEKEEDNSGKTEEEYGLKLVKKYSGFGTDEIIVKKLRLLDKNNVVKTTFWSDDSIKIELLYNSNIQIKNAIIWISFIYINEYDSDDNNLVCLGTKSKISIDHGDNVLLLSFDKVQLTTGEYKIALHIFDETFSQPYTQGHYGYFSVKNKNASLLRVGMSTPMCWTDVSVYKNNVQSTVF